MEREVRKLKTELENAVRQLRQNREHWFQVYGDMEKEHKKVEKMSCKEKKHVLT